MTRFRLYSWLASAVLLCLLLAGCATTSPPGDKDMRLPSEKTAEQPIEPFEDALARAEGRKAPPALPPMALPDPYQKLSPFEGRTFSANALDAPAAPLLYAIAEDAGLNLVIHNERGPQGGEPSRPPLAEQQVTLSLREAPMEEALKALCELTGYYYDLRGNILHLRRFQTKRIDLPYIKTRSSFESELGGDVLGTSSASESNLAGDFTMNYDHPEEANDFYELLEESLETMLSPDGVLSLNRFSGTLVVTDYPDHIERIADAVEQVAQYAGKQILIEAKIFEVTLSDNMALGINWNRVFEGSVGASESLTLTKSLGMSAPEGGYTGVLNYTRDRFSAVVSAMQTAGTVETLANPRIRVLNGQTAMISSGRIEPFWEKRVTPTTTTDANGNSSTTNVETYSALKVLDGIALGVTPVIARDGSIMLNIVPVSTSIEGRDESPNGESTAPIINVKEAGTIISAEDDSLVLIGGLISTRTNDNDYSVPGLGDIPLLGAMFRSTSTQVEKRELVILLRLRLIGA